MIPLSPRVLGALKTGASRLMYYTHGDLALALTWGLEVMAYESGLDPERFNAFGKLVLAKEGDTRPRWPGSKYVVDKGSGARGLFQKMPTNGIIYSVSDPAMQVKDAFNFWDAMIEQFSITSFKTLGEFYALNLLPAMVTNEVLCAKSAGPYKDTSRFTPAQMAKAAKLHTAYSWNAKLDPANKGYIDIFSITPILESATKAYASFIDSAVRLALEYEDHGTT